MLHTYILQMSVQVMLERRSIRTVALWETLLTYGPVTMSYKLPNAPHTMSLQRKVCKTHVCYMGSIPRVWNYVITAHNIECWSYAKKKKAELQSDCKCCTDCSFYQGFTHVCWLVGLSAGIHKNCSNYWFPRNLIRWWVSAQNRPQHPLGAELDKEIDPGILSHPLNLHFAWNQRWSDTCLCTLIHFLWKWSGRDGLVEDIEWQTAANLTTWNTGPRWFTYRVLQKWKRKK